ncbi:nucleotidyltransferase domain-containing protein [Kamptonema cortianum]|nr:nucleotidyltransferase domain-containing protein [Oscillatoria laete-virens]MDK3157899.1 nucleotidyltransferase domain-containing protein [Kamptonema cortianum]MDL5046029.1 nucleotidyltransferase domain-containing protein [Oscillatoria amoena NRMC-F 0135]MDL5052737.1 nucleotidyltransferase domain-containing protein [Oscillatoria laete-virens NRMC-F 0139]
MVDLEKYGPAVTRLCVEKPIRRLGLFGSALTNRFREDSDIDILVAFDESQEIDYFDEYFDLKDRLENIFQRKVDLVVEKKFRNPYFQRAVDSGKKIIYER